MSTLLYVRTSLYGAEAALRDAGVAEAFVWKGCPEDGDAVRTRLKVFAAK